MRVVLGLLLVVFGLACLNYTKPDALAHHQARADEEGLPEPGPAIHFGGGVSLLLGGLVFGGRRRGARHEPVT